MAETPGTDTLDAILNGIIQGHPERVEGWILGQPGCWGFLAGQAVLATKTQLGRPLADLERRQVWNRLWRLLELQRDG